MSEYTLHHGDCLDILPTIPAESVDAVITDPPYPMIKRDYGMLTEAEWWDLMMGVCAEVRRVLKPTGSAVFILQPNSRKVGSMRGWLWRFMWWVTEEWNMVQDAYWWNYTAIPMGGAPSMGLMRASVKPTIWAGEDICYRNQSSVMWEPSAQTVASAAHRRMGRNIGNGGTTPVDFSVAGTAYQRNGGVTPFNLFPVSQTESAIHGAGTPLKLADWWTRYIVPPGGTVLDPFNGAGTMGVAALQNGAKYIGIEKMAKYVDVSHERLAKVQPALVGAA